MNTLRQLFSVRALAAIKQNYLVNTFLPSEINPSNQISTAPTANNNNFLLNNLVNSTLLKNTTLGFVNNSYIKNYTNLDRKLEIAYLCKICNTRNVKTISEAAYNKGVVILQCDGCSTSHLIVDNLGWFANSKGKSVNQVIAEKGELVRRIVVNEKGEILKN